MLALRAFFGISVIIEMYETDNFFNTIYFYFYIYLRQTTSSNKRGLDLKVLKK